jgi:hypothetical protein
LDRNRKNLMMQFIKTVARLIIILILPGFTFSQSTYLPQGSQYEYFLDRLGIKLQTNPELNIFTPKPISRKMAVNVSEFADSLGSIYPYGEAYHLGKTDQTTLHSLLMNNSEWVNGSQVSFQSKHPIWNTFYKTQANFVEVNEKDFFLAINPVLQFQISNQTGNPDQVYLNTKGLTFRGRIGDHVGFSSYITDNQERGPDFFTQRVTASGYPAVPGVGYFKYFKGSLSAFDYWDARGSIDFEFWKYFTVQFGYDKNFIGDGYRSLFLSDYGSPYLFLKLNLRIWKLNYQNILMELVSQHLPGDYYYPKKYAVVHHLSVNATKWLNVGLYSNIAFSGVNNFEFSYLNPVIFLPAAQQENGSPDKTTVGFDFKANIAHSVQLYGQLLFNEFVWDQIKNYSAGWWGNKQGLQFGVKYIDMFKIKNLDLQAEVNVMRPYTYSHDDTVSNWSHYNQPLAHPFGANFVELIGILRYQPAYRWNIELKCIYNRQGLDSAGENFGSNILLNYNTRPRDYGFYIGSGIPAVIVNSTAYLSYQALENLFLEGTIMYRTYTVHYPGDFTTKTSSTMYTLGVRVNMFRRQYDY